MSTKLIDKVRGITPWKKRIRRYVEERENLKAEGDKIVFRLQTLNNRIREILQKHDKSKLRLGPLGQVALVTPVKTIVDVEGLIEWYQAKRPSSKPPVNYVPILDEKKLQIHFKKGIISPKRFATFVSEEEQNTYVRVDKPKGEGNVRKT